MSIDIVGVGYACVDSLGIVPHIPGPDAAARVDELDVQGGGVVAQALVAASRLGAKTAYVGNLGDDETGRYLQRDLHGEGIDVTHLTLEAGKRSPSSFIAVEKSTGHRTIFAYPGTMSPTTFPPAARQLIAAARYLHLDGTTHSAAIEAAQIARAAGVQVSLDACYLEQDREKTRRLVALTDILVANETFPRQLTGAATDEAACLALARLGPELVVSTQGSRGSLLVENGQVTRCPAFKVEIVDTTGAGDVFHGAFLVALGDGLRPADAVRFASAAAAINCRCFGGRPGIPRRAAVEEFLRAHPPA